MINNSRLGERHDNILFPKLDERLVPRRKESQNDHLKTQRNKYIKSRKGYTLVIFMEKKKKNWLWTRRKKILNRLKCAFSDAKASENSYFRRFWKLSRNYNERLKHESHLNTNNKNKFCTRNIIDFRWSLVFNSI